MVIHDLLAEYHERPRAEGLILLLKACSDPVYNVCFQVLRHREDAEDAAQQVLLKLLSALPSASDIDRFDRWMYRIAINTALNCRTERARRLARDHRRALMTDTEGVPGPGRDAVFEALADLDDDARSLVLQHFFEGRTLEEIARERGCSAVAVWKRIDRAKECLRQTLGGMGMSAVLPGLDELFRSIRPVRAPLDLVTEAIQQKAAALAAKASAGILSGGGLIMAGKGVSAALVAGLSIVLFVLGTGGGLLLGPTAESPAATTRAKPRTVPGIDPSAPLTLDSAAQASRTADSAVLSAPTPARGLSREALRAQLKNVGSLLRQAKKLPVQERERAQGLYKHLNEEWQSIQAAALGDATALLAFLRDPDNNEIVEDLIALVVSYELGPQFYSGNGPKELPRAVADGLADMLSDGLKVQKMAVLRWLSSIAGEGRTVLADRCLNVLLTERDSELLATTLNTLHIWDPMLNATLEGRLDILQNVWRNSSNWQVREQCLESLSDMKTPEGETLFLEKLQEVIQSKDPMVTQYIPQIVRGRIESLKLGEEDRYLPLLTSALSLPVPEFTYPAFLSLALELPPSRIADALEAARGHCPTTGLEASVNRALDLLRAGETRAEVLRRVLSPGS